MASVLQGVDSRAGRTRATTEDLLDVIEAITPLVQKNPFGTVLVLIGGCSRSGKSRLAMSLSSRLGNIGIPCLVVPLDNWVVSLDRRQPGSTVMERYDCAAIERNIRLLLQGLPVYPPVYDPRTRKRVSERSLEPLRAERGVVLVDGVIALALLSAREEADLRIYVDVDDQIRWARLMSFYCESKGMEPGEAEAILREREAEEIPIICASRTWANLIYLGR